MAGYYCFTFLWKTGTWGSAIGSRAKTDHTRCHVTKDNIMSLCLGHDTTVQ